MFRRRPALPEFPAQGALLVGGAARDWLRGVAAKDYDWAVPDPAAAARGLAERRQGSVFPLDEERGYWRVHLPGGEQHDFVPLPADVVSDLTRRDYTVNALALRVGGEVLDPTGGRADLRGGRLRLVSDANLRADPLRAWRGARFEVTLGLRPTPETEAALRACAADLAAGSLPMPAPERIRDELHALLSHPEAARGILRLEALGLLSLTLPELREGMGVVQGGFHHLDVFGHGVEALHQLLARTPDADLALRWAALLHDVGKPRARGQNPRSGRTTFYEHDKIGAAMTGQMLARLRVPGAVAERAAALVRAHMAQLPADERAARRFVHRRRPLLPDLLRVMLADREAARGPQSSPWARHAYAVAMNRVLQALDEQPEAPRRLLDGAAVMAELGLPPGPRVGEALRALDEAQALDEVQSEPEARAFLRRWAQGANPETTGAVSSEKGQSG